ncbi:hypothetical protein V6N11_040799 [Hibiscus sabdariffa]|uniref:Uncharacterized protein n=1 Tax=Hibiscus sabdariffa TaxID=183260 RepID=A0ABR2RIK8_9ROSI
MGMGYPFEKVTVCLGSGSMEELNHLLGLVWCGRTPPKVEGSVLLVVNGRAPVSMSFGVENMVSFLGSVGIKVVISNDLVSLLTLLDVHWNVLGKDEICFVIKSRLGWWIKAKQPSLLLSIDEFIPDPILMEKRLLNDVVLVTHSIWQPPPVRWLKFNIDGALGVGENVGGIGGDLRNECGQHLLTFSIQVEVLKGMFLECDFVVYVGER